MNPLRILFDFEAFSEPGGENGAAARHIFEIADHFATGGLAEVRIAAGWHRSRILLENPRPWITGRYLPAMRWTDNLRRRFNARETCRAIAVFKPDIVHRTDHRHVAHYAGPHKIVANVLDLRCFTHPESLSDAEAVRQGFSRATGTADHLFSSSSTTRNDALRILDVAGARMSVVPPGVRIPDRGDDRRPARGNFFLFVGERSGYKNFSALLQAVATTPTLSHTRIVAFGGGPLNSDERRVIAELNLQGRVVSVSGDDSVLAGHYSSAIALVFPSLYEGFANPILEAMAHGCPVACSRMTSLPEVGGDAVLYFDPTYPADIATALVHLSADIGLRERLAAAGRERAAQFTWNACAEKTLEGYLALVPTKRRVGAQATGIPR